MPLPEKPLTRVERYLARLAGQDVSIPDTPITRIEEYLAYILGQGGGVPASNGGAHNAVFRGKNLGSEYTSAQADAIDAGTFDDLFVGDYWEMPWGDPAVSVKFRIAGFDIYRNTGPTGQVFTAHHAVIVPDESLGSSILDNNGFANGYKGCYLRAEVLPGILASLETLFGQDSILTRKSRIYTASLSTTGWEDSRVDLIGAPQICGIKPNGATSADGERFSQYPLFALDPQRINIGQAYWTQSFPSTSTATAIIVGGTTGSVSMTDAREIRPYFCLGKVPSPGTRSPLPDYEAKRTTLDGSTP